MHDFIGSLQSSCCSASHMQCKTGHHCGKYDMLSFLILIPSQRQTCALSPT